MEEEKFAETVAAAAGCGAGSPTRTNSKKEKNEGEVADEAAKVSENWKRRSGGERAYFFSEFSIA